MRQQTLFQNAAGLEANIDRMLARLEKGYPEYRSDQPRGGDGRWSGGGGASISEGRARPGERARLAAEYERKYGGKAPSRMSADKLREHMAQRELEQKRSKKVGDIIDEMHRGKKRIDDATKDLNDPSKREAAAERIRSEAERTWDTLRRTPDNVFYEPGVADHFMDLLGHMASDPLFWLSSIALGGVPVGMLGVAIAVNGLYLMARWVYRKAVTGGRYVGVRRPETILDD